MTTDIYSILIPVLILVVGYFVNKPKPKRVTEFVNFLFKMLYHLWGYSFFLYYIDTEKFVDAGWANLNLFIYLVPISIIIILLKMFFWIKNRKASNT